MSKNSHEKATDARQQYSGVSYFSPQRTASSSPVVSQGYQSIMASPAMMPSGPSVIAQQSRIEDSVRDEHVIILDSQPEVVSETPEEIMSVRSYEPAEDYSALVEEEQHEESLEERQHDLARRIMDEMEVMEKESVLENEPHLEEMFA